jgi:saposin
MKAILIALCLVAATLAISVQQVEKPKVVKNDEWCSICQFVIGYIEGEVANNQTEENIIHVVQTVCDIVPSGLQSQCKSLISIYGEDIIQLLVNDEPASVVCSQIGLCDSKVEIQVEENKQGTGDCSMCQFLMGYVESELGNNYTVANIEQVLDQVCTLVPSAFKAQCVSLINEYTSQLIQLLLNEETPELICQQIGLCSSEKSKMVVLEVPKASEYCTVCEFVLSTAEQYLDNNATDKQIILFIENVCYILPTTIRQECDDLIATYATEIITLLIQDYPPNVVCTEIGLCSSAKKEKVRATPSECQACKNAITAVESLHLNSAKAIEQALLYTCNALPKSAQSECQTFIQTIGQAVIQKIQNNEDPKTVCADIGVCTKQ